MFNKYDNYNQGVKTEVTELDSFDLDAISEGKSIRASLPYRIGKAKEYKKDQTAGKPPSCANGLAKDRIEMIMKQFKTHF